MYSKEESKALRVEFWDTFGKLSKKKRKGKAWILYNTKIKDFSLKFTAEQKFCSVSIDMEFKNTERRYLFFDNMQTLSSIFNQKFDNKLVWDRDFVLPNGKIISRIHIDKDGVSVYNKNVWGDMFSFLFDNMNKMEELFVEYKDIIKEFDN
jgi:hypothetical protein